MTADENKNKSQHGDSLGLLGGEGEKSAVSGTPFMSVKAKCPVCDAGSDQLQFMDGIYLEAETDIVLRPTKYVWKIKKYKKYHPPLFYIWSCPECGYSACQQYFEHPTTDMALSGSNFKKRINEYLYGPGEVGSENLEKLLPERQSPEAVTFYDAARRYLAAILILEQISSVRTRDALPLGRYYLRLAWLYRDLLDSPERDITFKKLMALKQMMKDAWSNMPINEEAALSKALNCYETAFFNSRIMEKKKIVHNIAQLLGRLHVRAGNINEGRNLLWKSIQHGSNYKNQIKDEMKYSFDLAEAQRDAANRKIDKLNAFISETQELLYNTRQKKKTVD